MNQKNNPSKNCSEVIINYNPKPEYYDYTIDDWVVDTPPKTTFEYEGLEVGKIVQQKSGLICLESKFIFIADIDCGDNIENTKRKIIEFQKNENSIFRLYKTKNGLRVIRADLPYFGVNKSAIKLLTYLDSDPKYIDCCREINRFVARITPKMSRESIEKYFNRAYVDSTMFNQVGIKVCHLLGDLSTFELWQCGRSPMLSELIYTHDQITNPWHFRRYKLL